MKKLLLIIVLCNISAQDVAVQFDASASSSNLGNYLGNLFTRRELIIFAGGIATGAVLTKLFWPTRRHARKKRVEPARLNCGPNYGPNRGMLRSVNSGIFTNSEVAPADMVQPETPRRMLTANSQSFIPGMAARIYAELDQAQAEGAKFNKNLEQFRQAGREKTIAFVNQENMRFGGILAVARQLARRVP